jgi:hypothetical protein
VQSRDISLDGRLFELADSTVHCDRKNTRSFPLPHKLSHKTFTLDHLLTVCEGLSKRALAQIINLDVLGHMGMGWPDLTLQKDTALMFVEVKQSQDKFTHRQAYWIRNYAIPLGLDFTVLHVTPSIKVGLRRRVNKEQSELTT